MYNLCENYERVVNVSTRTERVLTRRKNAAKREGNKARKRREEGEQKRNKGQKIRENCGRKQVTSPNPNTQNKRDTPYFFSDGTEKYFLR